jgi:hypothetical protein
LKTPDQQKIAAPTNLQILSQAKLVEEVGVKPVEKIINELVIEGQSNLRL